MPTTRRLRLCTPDAAALAGGLAIIRQELQLPGAFPPDVEAAARAAAAAPRLPEADRSDLDLVTLDPPDAMDLDQAMHIERRGDGYRVHYAIADVAAFVSPGDAIDREAWRRGETLYGIDGRIPLHPPALSEGAASLLPGELRPALLWAIDLDAEGEGVAVDVRRALVRSRARFDYAALQAAIDDGRAAPRWALLREVGERRRARERRLGGVSLPLPEQEVRVEDGHWTLAFRARHPVEDWNEQVSLLTGMAAAHLMAGAGVGLLRTLPEAAPHALERLRRTACALGVDWPAARGYPDFIRTLDAADPRHVAMMTAATTVLRGAGYVAFADGAPEDARHAALATRYSHATAPLRRLVDRYTGETCLALCAGRAPPGWVLEALPRLPGTMQASAQRASRFESMTLDLAEAVALAPRVGEVFDGAVVEVERKDAGRGEVMLREPAILARATSATGPLPLGEPVRLRLVEADPGTRTIAFEYVGPASAPPPTGF